MRPEGSPKVSINKQGRAGEALHGLLAGEAEEDIRWRKFTSASYACLELYFFS